jgi:GNAT superfamily N-acetyltransferase
VQIEVGPFLAEHLEPAASLLAARHTADRDQEPVLPSHFSAPHATLDILEQAWAEPGIEGVIAYGDGLPVGYLLGAPYLAAPTDAFTGDHRPRSAVIVDAWHAAAPICAEAVYPRLYAALAERWLARGIFTHYVTVPAGSVASDAFFTLGFGQMEALAVRDSAPLAVAATLPADIEIRHATLDDRQIVVDLVAEMLRAFAAPPACWPFLLESLPALDEFVGPLVGRVESPIWLAVRDQRVIALQLFATQEARAWYWPPLVTPERAVLLFAASTAPEARGGGVGTALLAWSLDWARKAGYDHCLLYYLTATSTNPYWTRHGYRPLRHRLGRTVDERVAWAARGGDSRTPRSS